MPTAPARPRPRWRAARRRLLTLLGVAFALVAPLTAVRAWHEAYPPDRVDVTVPPPPAGEEAFALIADDATGGAPLPFYNERNVAIPWSGELARYMARGEGLKDTDGDGLLDFAVRWHDAPRLGVLTRGRDGRPLVRWLAPGDVAGPSALRFLGGGSATLRWPAAAKAEPPSPALRERLGVADDQARP